MWKGLGFRVEGFRWWKGLGFRVQGLGLKGMRVRFVEGFRVQGLKV